MIPAAFVFLNLHACSLAPSLFKDANFKVTDSYFTLQFIVGVADIRNALHQFSRGILLAWPHIERRSSHTSYHSDLRARRKSTGWKTVHFQSASKHNRSNIPSICLKFKLNTSFSESMLSLNIVSNSVSLTWSCPANLASLNSNSTPQNKKNILWMLVSKSTSLKSFLASLKNKCFSFQTPKMSELAKSLCYKQKKALINVPQVHRWKVNTMCNDLV